MSNERPVETVEVADIVEEFVTEENYAAAKYDNKTVLDDGGVWALHTIAARIYALGWQEGERTAETRRRGRDARAHGADQRAAAANLGVAGETP